MVAIHINRDLLVRSARLDILVLKANEPRFSDSISLRFDCCGVTHLRSNSILLVSTDRIISTDESSEWMSKFKSMLERTRNENDNSSVIIVCHSYGCPFVQYFLKRSDLVDQKWKDTNVRALVGVAGAWAGHYRTLYKYIGDERDDLLTNLFPQIRRVERTFSSTSYLLPRGEIWRNHVLVRTPKRNYTANDLEALFDDMHEEDLLEKYRDARKAWGTFEHPGVELHCISGKGFPVPEKVTLNGPSFIADATSKMHYGDGDGRLHIISQRACREYASQRLDKQFSYQEINYEHIPLVQERGSLDHILSVIESIV